METDELFGPKACEQLSTLDRIAPVCEEESLWLLPSKFPLGATVVVGGGAAAKGIADIVKSQAVAKGASVLHETALQDLEVTQKPVHECVAE